MASPLVRAMRASPPPAERRQADGGAPLPEVARAAMADWRSTADQRLLAITAMRELADTIGG